jgi:hypothetical protein
MLFDLQLLGKLGAAGNADVIESRTPAHTDAKCLAPSEPSGLNQNSRSQSSEPQLRLMRCRLFFCKSFSGSGTDDHRLGSSDERALRTSD